MSSWAARVTSRPWPPRSIPRFTGIGSPNRYAADHPSQRREVRPDPVAEDRVPFGLGEIFTEPQGVKGELRAEHREGQALLDRQVGVVLQSPEPEDVPSRPIALDFRDAKGRVERQAAARAAAVVHLDPEVGRGVDRQIDLLLAADLRLVRQIEALVGLLAPSL